MRAAPTLTSPSRTLSRTIDPTVPAYTDWLKQVSPEFTWDWKHLDYIREHLAAVTLGTCRKLAISVPPQFGKTEITTVRYPLWRMLREPGIRVGIASYNQKFTNKQSRKTRRLVRRLGLAMGDVDAIDEWTLANGSTFVARGAGAGIAGEPLDCICIDDPFKNRQEADSQTIQERVYEWYMDDVTPRVQKEGSIIIIHTRWNPGDLIGRIQESEESHEWTYVVLKALAEEGDPMGRAAGDSLCHAAGTLICDNGWMRVEDHPSFTDFRSGFGCRVRVWGLPDAEVVTPEHRYWVTSERRPMVVNGRRVRTGVNRPPGWVEAKDLDRACSIGLPIDTRIALPQAIAHLVADKGGGAPAGTRRAPLVNWHEEMRVPAEFHDPEWWWYFGLWWGDGSLWGGISVHLSDLETESRVIRLCERYGRRVRITDCEGCRRVSFENSNLERWLKTWRIADCRKQPPQWVELIDLKFQAALVRGYLDADGCVNKVGARISSIHLPGLLCLRRILARLGIPSSIASGRAPRVDTIQGRRVNCQQEYRLLFREGTESVGLSFPTSRCAGRGRAKGSFIEDNHLWSKVRDVEVAEGAKYCPITTETETYTTDFGLSHNCPDRFTRENLEAKRRTEGVGFESLYQQNPIPRGGTFFERSWFLDPNGRPAVADLRQLPLMTPMPGGRRLIRYWDLAASRSDSACYTAGVLLAKIGEGEDAMYYVVDVIRGRWMPAERNDVMLQTAILDSQIPGFEKTWFEQPVFDKQRNASRAIYARLAGHPVSADNVSGAGSKELRAEPVAGAAKGGIVKIVGGAWNAAFLSEVEGFPRTTYKDQTDSLSGGFSRLSRGGFAISVG